MEGSQPVLRRSLGLVQVVLYGVGLILGAGIYVIIGDVSAISGNAIWISFILAAVIASFTGLSYAELASMFPKSAAEYIYVKHAFGINFVALFVGCLTIFVAITSAAYGSDWLFRLSLCFFPASIINSICSNIDNSSINYQFLRD